MRFRDVLRTIVASSLAGVACGGETTPKEVPAPKVDTTGLAPIACTPEEPLPGVSSAPPASYVEHRRSLGDPRVLVRGTRCGGATDPAKCESDYAAVPADAAKNQLFGQPSQVQNEEVVIVTDVNGVQLFTTRDHVRAWIAPVDAPGDAVATAELAGYSVTCGDVERGAVGAVAGGFRVVATMRTSECNPVESKVFLLEVDASGRVTVLDSKVISSQPSCIGRRPEGLVSPTFAATSAIGRWLAEVAYLEEASVASFDRLAAELERFGAPRSLVARARRASADEVRHAAAMRRLAENYGAEVPSPSPMTFAARGFEAFAEENAIEGCVLETFGAVIGLAQAELATDPEIRRTMKRIAADETRHGALAWDVHAWAMTKLDPDQRRRVEAAQAEAVASLRESAPDVDLDAATVLGLPTPALRRALAASFHLHVPKMWPSTRAWKMKYGGRQAPTPGGASGTAEQT